MSRASFRALVHGIVQGVRYRDFVLRNAQILGIAGYVENLDDGGVLVVAEGEEAQLEQLIDRITTGPPEARVADAIVAWAKDVGKYSRFEIRF